MCVYFFLFFYKRIRNTPNVSRISHNYTSVADKLLAPPAADSDGESDGSERVPVPSFQNSFSQAFEKALLELDNGTASPPQMVVEPGL